MYPSGDAYYLRQRLAEKFGKDPDQFLVGNGANEVISFVIKASASRATTLSRQTRRLRFMNGWRNSPVCRKTGSPQGLRIRRSRHIGSIDERTKIVFICNPNNPTGTYWNRDKLRSFLDTISGRVVVVVDEAYCEFVESDDYPDGMSLIDEYPNLVIFRTFPRCTPSRASE